MRIRWTPSAADDLESIKSFTPLPYVVVYRVHLDAVEVLHVFRGSQDWRS